MPITIPLDPNETEALAVASKDTNIFSSLLKPLKHTFTRNKNN